VFRAETEIIGTLMRTDITGADDVPNVRALQQQYLFVPLSEFAAQKPPPPVAPIRFPKWDEKRALSAGFIGYLNVLLQFCQPAHPSEQAMLTRFAKIGVGAGRPFDLAKLDPKLRAALEAGAADGLASIRAVAAKAVSSDDYFGTRAFLGDDFLMKRSVGAMLGIYGNSKEEALYKGYQLGPDGKPLNAATDRYVLRFPPGGKPAVQFFWSLTMYSVPDRFLVDNPIDRYAIGDRTPGLRDDPDGGLTLYIQPQSPGPDKASNWLPAPAGPFFMVIRMYGPDDEMLSGRWKAPELERVQ
jgi:hypothetical protein